MLWLLTVPADYCVEKNVSKKFVSGGRLQGHFIQTLPRGINQFIAILKTDMDFSYIDVLLFSAADIRMSQGYSCILLNTRRGPAFI